MSKETRIWLLIGVVTIIFGYLNYRNEDPYMDEIFHVPQAQRYCQNKFSEWDSKITTFPGLYYVSTVFQRLLWMKECEPALLRAVSLFSAVGLLFLLQRCRKMIAGEDSSISTLIFLYPCNAMYYFLYYTDTISLTSFLLSYWHSRASLYSVKQKPDVKSFGRCRSLGHGVLSFLLCSCSVLMRQTNSIWLLFIAGTLMLEELEFMGLISTKEDLFSVVKFVCLLWKERVHLFYLTWPQLLPVMGFILFLISNGGSVVLGDKENHQLSLHWVMIVYPLALYGVLMIPNFLARLLFAIKMKDAQTNWLSLLGTWNVSQVVGYGALYIVAMSAFVWGSRSHPFILSDNRHYIFYVWRYFLQHFSLRCLLAPAFALAVVLCIADMRKRRSDLWLLILACAVVITLLPSPLLEPRYFSQALTVLLLNSPKEDDNVLFKAAAHAQLGSVALLNLILTYIFLFRTFVGHDGSLARFMF